MHEFQPQGFGEYLLHDRIGAGGMAEIFLATAQGIEGFEKRLVIKRILPTLSDDEQFVRMFIEEAKLCVALRHPNIVQVYDLGEIDAQYFIAMEYVDGRDLLKTLAACGRKKIGFPTDIALYIVMEVLKGLDYAHKLKRPDGDPLGIIHRDVSPSNVLLSFEGEVKIGDFGIAKASTREKTATGILKGKFGYMAPEQVTGTPIDHKADIFAVGIVLYELLTGHRLFAGKNDLAVLERVRDAVIDPPPRFYRADLDPELEHIVMTALARKPSQRYQTSTELHDALHDYVYRSRAMIGPAHLGRFMQTLFLADDAEIERRARVSLPLFGHDSPDGANGAASFGPEATEDERGHSNSEVSGLVDNTPLDGDFDEKTPLVQIDDGPASRTVSSLSGQVAMVEDAASFERDVILPDEPVEEIEDRTASGRPPSDAPVLDTSALDSSGSDKDQRTARTDVSQPVDAAFDGEEVGSEAIIDFLTEETEEDQEDRSEIAARAEVQAIREAHAQNAPTDWDLESDPRHPRNVTPTPLTVPEPTAESSRLPSAIDTALNEDEELSSSRSWSPAEIVERTASSIDVDPTALADDDESHASEVEPTVRFDSAMYPALRTPPPDEDDTASASTPSLSVSRPPLTDDYPDRGDSGFGTIEVQESDLPTAEVDESILSQLDFDTSRSPSTTEAGGPEEPVVQAVDDDDPLAVTHTEVDDDDLDDETITASPPTVVPVEDETELTAELEDEVRLALATDRDYVSVIDTSPAQDDDEHDDTSIDPAAKTDAEPLPERKRSRRRPISGRRPRPVLLPASEDQRDNLARQPSTRQVLPRRVSPRRRVTTRASLSVVNPKSEISGRTARAESEATGRDMDAIVDEHTMDGSFEVGADPTPRIDPGALPNRRNSSGITAALDEAAAVDDEIEEIRRSSSIATHEPTALGRLADALENEAHLPVIDFEADEPTQDGSDLRKAIMRRQSRKRMVTRSVVLYDEDGEPLAEEMNRPFEDDFTGSEMSAPAITSAGQLEDPEADDLFGALAVLDDHDDELGFDDDDVSLETMSRADARPPISVDERQAIPVPPTEPTELPDSSRPFELVAPSTRRGPIPIEESDGGFVFSFDEDEEATASVNDAHVVSISRLNDISGDDSDVIELGGSDSLEAPNPSSVSISFGSMSSVAAVPDDDDEFTTVNEPEEHADEIGRIRNGSLGLADETTAEGHSDIMAGRPDLLDPETHEDNNGGLLVSESFEFGVERQESLRSEPLARRPSPTSPPPPVRPVSMVRAPGGVEPSYAEVDAVAPVRPQRPNNASALRAVVERHRPVREKRRTPDVPGRASGTPAAASPTSPKPPQRATGTPRPVGVPGMRTTGTGRPAKATGTADAYPVAQVQIRRTSHWTTVMYVMVAIAVVLAVAAAVSSILLKGRSAVPIAPLPATQQEAPPTKPAETPPTETKTAANTATPDPTPPPAKTAKAPEPAKTKPVAPPPPVKKAVAPPPPAPKKSIAKRPRPKPKKRARRVARRTKPAPVAAPPTTAAKKKKKKKKKKVRATGGMATIETNCSEPTTIRISGGPSFAKQTKFSHQLAPGSYRLTFRRGGVTVRRVSVQAIAGRVATVPCP